MKKIALTGATGFIGKRLLKKLNAECYEVACLTREGSQHYKIQNAQSYVYDGTVNSIDRLNVEFEPDLWIHLATNYVPEESDNDIDGLIASNVDLSTKLFQSISKLPTPALINVGTAWQTFEGKTGVAANLYAATKNANEAILDYYVDRYAFKALTIYLYDTYDDFDERGKLLDLLLNLRDDSEALKLSPGEQELNLLHVDDVNDGILVAAKRMSTHGISRVHERFDVRADETITLCELINLIEKIKGKSLPIRLGAKSYRAREVMTLARNVPLLPNWSESDTLESNLSKIINGNSQPNDI